MSSGEAIVAVMDAVEERSDGVLIRTRLQPKASKEEILGEVQGRVRMRVASPPVEGAANEAAIRLLARTLRVAKSHVRLIRGERSREKDFLVSGIEVQAVKDKMHISTGESNHD